MKEITDYRPQKVDKGLAQQLFYTLYSPEPENIRATILVIHGMQEHSGRYNELAHYLVKQGFVVLTYDHIGHGKTAATENDLGFFQLHQPDRQLVNDAENMADYVEKLYPTVPHFVLGHSMGSFVARCLLQQAGARFHGAVLVGTGGKTKVAPLARFIFTVLNTICPRRRTFFNTVFIQMNNKRFRKEPNCDGTNWLSLNKANRVAFQQDSLCGVPFTINGFYTLLSLNVKATQRDWAKRISKDLPFLFLSGAEDPIGDFGEGVWQTEEQLEADGFKDVSSQVYFVMRHEILQEEIKLKVFQYIEEWISEHL